jgi:hypothetical protein
VEHLIRITARGVSGVQHIPVQRRPSSLPRPHETLSFVFQRFWAFLKRLLYFFRIRSPELKS